MKVFTRVSSKLIILSFVPLLIFSTIIFASIKISTDRNQSAQHTLEYRLNQTQQLNLIIRTFTSDIIDVAHKARSGMALWKDAATQVSSAKEIISQQWQSYQSSSLSDQEISHVNGMDSSYQNSIKAIDKISAYMIEASSYGMGNFVDLEMYGALEPFLLHLDQLVILQKALARKEIKANTKLAKQTNQTIFLVIAGVALTILLLGISIFRSISKPLKHLKKTMISVEKQSNLALRVELNSKDELGEIGQSFNGMMDRITQFVHTISNIGSALDSATENTLTACIDARNQVISTQNELSDASASIIQMTKAVEVTQSQTEKTIMVSKEADTHVV